MLEDIKISGRGGGDLSWIIPWIYHALHNKYYSKQHISWTNMVTRIELAVLIITVVLKELIHKQKMESNMQHYKLVFSKVGANWTMNYIKEKLPIRTDKSFKKN